MNIFQKIVKTINANIKIIKLKLFAEKEKFHMGKSKNAVANSKEALNKFKMEAANEVGVNLKKQGYNGNLTSKEAGSVGGQKVKKMVEKYESEAK